MAFIGLCDGCRDNNHHNHVEHFNTPPPSAEFVCGGGICACARCEPELSHLLPEE